VCVVGTIDKGCPHQGPFAFGANLGEGLKETCFVGPNQVGFVATDFAFLGTLPVPGRRIWEGGR
jgi:hypothetical protein